MPPRRSRELSQLASGLVSHLTLGAALIFVVNWSAALPDPPATPRRTLVWTAPSVPGGGGGSGSSAPGPASRQVHVEHTASRIDVPSVPAAFSLHDLPGIAVVSASAPPGEGIQGGSEGAKGKGTGPGNGIGDSPLPGAGGDGFESGAPGVVAPVPIVESRPEYTPAAMRARVQGIATLEATVLVDGSVANVRVIRSLDDRFGLDQKAIEAVKRWRFRPGTRFGKPVPVRVIIELMFTLR